MSPSIDPLERITNLLTLLLESRAALTAEDITNELGWMYPSGAEARRGAFERDKALLRDVGVPIETEVLGGDRAGQTAYRLDRRRYELRDLDLADDERQALQVAMAASRSEVAQEGMWKLGGAALGPSPLLAEVPQLRQLPVLREAANDRHPVRFGYRGSSRTLEPYALLLRSGNWYVIGHDRGRGEVRTYRVDRVEGDVDVDASSTFTRPEGFSVADAFPVDPMSIGAEPVVEALVVVDAARAPQVRAELGEEAVRAVRGDGSVELAVPHRNEQAFRSWLLGFGEHAEVLGPPSVRASFVAWLRSIAVQA